MTTLAPLIAWVTFVFPLDAALASPHFGENSTLLERGRGLQVVSSTPHEITLSLQVPTIAVDTVTLGGNSYDTIQIQGWSSTEAPGLPNLPFYSCLIAIPECRNIDVVAAVTDSQVSYGYNVCPAERWLMKVDPDGIPFREHVFEIDHSAYASNQFYPSPVCEIVDVFYLRDQKVGRLNIYPVRFNPAREQLAIYSKIDIEVRPQSPSGPTSTPLGPYETIAERLVVGYQAGGGSTRPGLLSTSPLDGSADWCHSVEECADLQADYLMITAHRFFQDGDSSSPAFELAEHRASLNGFNVAIVDVDVVAPPMQESRDVLIKDFIDSLYSSRTAEHMSDGHLGYCLLVGGFKDASADTLIPVHWVESWLPDEHPDYPCDNWFAELDTTAPAAHYPQLEIGRLPVIDNTDIEVVVGKILSSEPLPDADGWTQRVFLTSGWNINSPDERDTLENTFASIANIAAAADLDTLLFRGDWKSRSYDFISENCRVINSGTRFVYYAVHGARCQMAAPPAFSTSSMSCFTNIDSPPIFFTGACKTASFDSLCPGSEGATTGIGAELLSLPGGGVVAFLGPADAGDLHADFGGCVDVFRSWVKYHSPLLGDAWFEAKLRHPAKFCQSFTLLGDPAFHVLLRESGVGYCDLGVRQDDFNFEPDLDVVSRETTISIPVNNLTPYRADAETLRVHFYAKSDTADASQWMLIDSTFVGPIEAGSEDTASVLWNLAEIEPGYYNVKVVLDPRDDLREAYENNNVALTTGSIGLSLAGFPVSLGAEPVTSPTFASLVGAGKEAYILVCTDDGSVRLVSPSGRLAKTYKTESLPIFSVAVGDLCCNGSMLQVVSSGNSLRAIDMSSKSPTRTKWVLPLPDEAISSTSPSLTDLDFDQVHDLEIVIGVLRGTSSQILAVDCSTDSAWVVWSTTLGDTSAVGLPVDPLLLVNLDGASEEDVVVSTSRGLLFALDGQTGRIFSTADISPTDALAATNPVASDLDLDGSAEIVCCSSVLTVHKADTLLTLEACSTLNNEVGLYLSTGNIDLQESVDSEIVLGTTNRLVVFDYDLSQTPRLQERFSFPMSSPVHTVPAIGDVMWDNGPEIVFGAGDSLYILSSEGELIARRNLNGTVASSPCLVDMSEDGLPEIIVGIAGGIEAIPGRGQTANTEWQMFGGDLRHRSVKSVVLSGSLASDRIIWGRNTIAGNLTVPEQQTLIVEAGATIEFTPGPGVPRGEMCLKVKGDLVLNGTVDQPVTFTSGYFEKSPGDWDALEIYSAPNPATIAHSDFEYAYQGLRTSYDPTIERCSFRYCADCGIWADGSPDVRSCAFKGNMRDVMLHGTNAVVESCYFEDHAICGVWSWGGSPLIRSNKFIASGCQGCGIWFVMPISIDISDNWIEGYGSLGIASSGGLRDVCRIHHNTVKRSCGPGMAFSEYLHPIEHFGHAEVDSNIIFQCGYGVWSDVWDHLHDYPVISHNIIKENIYKDAKNTCPWLEIDASHNWWGFDCNDPDTVSERIEGSFWIDPCLDSDPYAGVGYPRRAQNMTFLEENAPNPFRCATNIRFTLGTRSNVRLAIYNVRGQLVKTLLNGPSQEGEHSILWSGETATGAEVSPGVYFSVLLTEDSKHVRKLVLLK